MASEYAASRRQIDAAQEPLPREASWAARRTGKCWIPVESDGLCKLPAVDPRPQARGAEPVIVGRLSSPPARWTRKRASAGGSVRALMPDRPASPRAHARIAAIRQCARSAVPVSAAACHVAFDRAQADPRSLRAMPRHRPRPGAQATSRGAIIGQTPAKSGLRRSMNAATPSRDSERAPAVEIADASRSS